MLTPSGQKIRDTKWSLIWGHTLVTKLTLGGGVKTKRYGALFWTGEEGVIGKRLVTVKQILDKKFTFICVKTVSRTLKKVLNKFVKCAREGLIDFVFKGKIMAQSGPFLHI